MPLRVMRYLDLVVLAVALPIFIAAGFPVIGWAAVAAAWLVQRGVQQLIEKRARAAKDPGTVAGLMTASMIARGWLVAGAIFAVGLSEREAGLAGAILAIVLFSVYFMGQILTRPFAEPR